MVEGSNFTSMKSVFNIAILLNKVVFELILII